MIEPLENLPAGVIGFRATGTVEPADYDNVLEPAIESARAGGGKVNMVYVIGEDFDRYSLGALWKDAKLGASSPRSWNRLALVTDHDWLGQAVSIMGFLIPGDVKVFELSEQDGAIKWAAGSGD